MNVKNLKEGMIIKNYAELCSILEIEQRKGGNARRAQLKEIDRYFNYEKDGYKIIITEIFDTPIVKRNNSYNYFIESSPHKIDKVIDTYDIELIDLGTYTKQVVKWLCEKCNDEFNSTMKEISKYNDVLCRSCRMSKGARKIFKILNNLSLNVELEYSFKDLMGDSRNLRFDFAILENNKLIALIEYDGGFHDTGEQDRYDQLKNDYCKMNNIPLLRVHHSVKDITETVVEFIKLLKLESVNYSYYIRLIDDEIAEYENKIKELKLKRKGLINNG